VRYLLACAAALLLLAFVFGPGAAAVMMLAQLERQQIQHGPVGAVGKTAATSPHEES
jgi:hypothetical protein